MTQSKSKVWIEDRYLLNRIDELKRPSNSRLSGPGILWRRIDATILLGISLISFVISMFFITANGDEQGNRIVAAAAFAISGVVFTAGIKLHSEIRDRAFKFLEESVKDEELYASMRRLRELNKRLRIEKIDQEAFATILFFSRESLTDHKFSSNLTEQQKVEWQRLHEKKKALPAKLFDWFIEYPSRQVIKDIHLVSNFFERIYIAIFHKETHERILFDFYCGMFVRYYKYLSGFEDVLRNPHALPGHIYGDYPAPEVFSGVESLYERWHDPYKKKFQNKVEIDEDIWLKKAETDSLRD